MKKQTFKSLGIEIALNVPENVDEFDLNAGGGTTPKPGTCLAEAINNVVYRGSLADYRANFLEALELLTGNERKTEPTGKKVKVSVKNADGSTSEVEEDQLKFAETEAEYFNRIVAESGKEIGAFAGLAQLIIDGVKVAKGDSTEVDPAQKAKLEEIVLANEWKADKIDEAVNAIGIGVPFDAAPTERKPRQPKKTGAAYLKAAEDLISQGQAEAVAAKLTKALGRSVAADKESLGKAIQEWEARRRAEEAKKLAATLTSLSV